MWSRIDFCNRCSERTAVALWSTRSTTVCSTSTNRKGWPSRIANWLTVRCSGAPLGTKPHLKLCTLILLLLNKVFSKLSVEKIHIYSLAFQSIRCFTDALIRSCPESAVTCSSSWQIWRRNFCIWSRCYHLDPWIWTTLTPRSSYRFSRFILFIQFRITNYFAFRSVKMPNLSSHTSLSCWRKLLVISNPGQGISTRSTR